MASNFYLKNRHLFEDDSDDYIHLQKPKYISLSKQMGQKGLKEFMDDLENKYQDNYKHLNQNINTIGIINNQHSNNKNQNHNQPYNNQPSNNHNLRDQQMFQRIAQNNLVTSNDNSIIGSPAQNNKASQQQEYQRELQNQINQKKQIIANQNYKQQNQQRQKWNTDNINNQNIFVSNQEQDNIANEYNKVRMQMEMKGNFDLNYQKNIDQRNQDQKEKVSRMEKKDNILYQQQQKQVEQEQPVKYEPRNRKTTQQQSFQVNNQDNQNQYANQNNIVSQINKYKVSNYLINDKQESFQSRHRKFQQPPTDFIIQYKKALQRRALANKDESRKERLRELYQQNIV